MDNNVPSFAWHSFSFDGSLLCCQTACDKIDYMDLGHYKTYAQWLRELGLLTVGSLVIQKIVLGAPLGDPVVVAGIIISVVCYVSAVSFLKKSLR